LKIIKNYKKNNNIQKLSSHTDIIKKIFIHKNLIFTFSLDKTIKVWDLEGLKLKNTIFGILSLPNCFDVFGDSLFFDYFNDNRSSIFEFNINNGFLMKEFFNFDNNSSISNNNNNNLNNLNYKNQHITFLKVKNDNIVITTNNMELFILSRGN
jgi:WD40 repeat protein